MWIDLTMDVYNQRNSFRFWVARLHFHACSLCGSLETILIVHFLTGPIFQLPNPKLLQVFKCNSLR